MAEDPAGLWRSSDRDRVIYLDHKDDSLELKMNRAHEGKDRNQVHNRSNY
jgi:hypothetical protein